MRAIVLVLFLAACNVQNSEEKKQFEGAVALVAAANREPVKPVMLDPDTFVVYTMNPVFDGATVSVCDTLRSCRRGQFPPMKWGWWRYGSEQVVLKAPAPHMNKFRLHVRYADGRRSSFTVNADRSTRRALWIYLHVHGFENAPMWPALSPGYDGFDETYPDGKTPGVCKDGTTWIECGPPPRHNLAKK